MRLLASVGSMAPASLTCMYAHTASPGASSAITATTTSSSATTKPMYCTPHAQPTRKQRRDKSHHPHAHTCWTLYSIWSSISPCVSTSTDISTNSCAQGQLISACTNPLLYTAYAPAPLSIHAPYTQRQRTAHRGKEAKRDGTQDRGGKREARTLARESARARQGKTTGPETDKRRRRCRERASEERWVGWVGGNLVELNDALLESDDVFVLVLCA